MFAVLARIAEGPSPAAVDWAKRGVVSEFARDLASGHGSVRVGQAAAAAGLSFAELKDYPVRVDEVGGAEVRALLAECVGHEAATVLGPTVDLAALNATVVDWKAAADALAER
jgi:hypothetical protein